MSTLRILIADDEGLRLLSLRDQLYKLGHRVVGEANDGRLAVELARELKPDMAILDIIMPEMDGIEATRQIMNEHPLPIILLSAYSQCDLADRAAGAHAAAYLVKPVSDSDLLPAISLAISRFKEFQALHQEVDDLRETLETRKMVERAKSIMMRRLHLSEEEAFRRLQLRSQNENRKMGDLAKAIVTADSML